MSHFTVLHLPPGGDKEENVLWARADASLVIQWFICVKVYAMSIYSLSTLSKQCTVFPTERAKQREREFSQLLMSPGRC